MTEYRVALNEQDFRRLCRGGEITYRTGDAAVKIILSDIGFGRILRAVMDASRIDRDITP